MEGSYLNASTQDQIAETINKIQLSLHKWISFFKVSLSRFHF